MPPRRLTMRTLLPENSSIDLAGFPGVPPEWQKAIEVRGQLTIAEIGELFEVEQEIKANTVAQEIRHPVEKAYQLVMGVLREFNPDLPDLPFGIDETLKLMAWLAGDDSVADAVIDAIRGHDTDEMVQGEGDDEQERPPSLAEQGDGRADAAPLPSAPRSRKRSSQSAKGSPSAPSGGETPAGERSEATSHTSRAVA